MSIQEVSPEQFAELFHHYHHALGPDFGCAVTPESEAWEQLPRPEKNRLIAAVRLALMELAAAARAEENRNRYFARPGEAEWGC